MAWTDANNGNVPFVSPSNKAVNIDGTVLDPDPVTGASFPILDGLRTGDHKRNLEKVEVYRRVVDALGQTALSEVHIDDAQEVTVVSASDPVLVNLGTVADKPAKAQISFDQGGHRRQRTPAVDRTD